MNIKFLFDSVAVVLFVVFSILIGLAILQNGIGVEPFFSLSFSVVGAFVVGLGWQVIDIIANKKSVRI